MHENMLDAAASISQSGDPKDSPAAGWMPSVPDDVRSRIRSGMQWTVWLSFLTVPFSYATKVLLARVGPEVIGVYGLLLVYIGIVTCIFYFGGDSVAIKFLPELDRTERARFMFSYALVISALMVPWLGLAALFPDKLHYLFGRGLDKNFLLLILCLAPIPILFSLVQSALKAFLDFRRAQLVARSATVGTFLTYAFLFLFYQHWLAQHATEAIWSVYLVFTTAGAGLGLFWLRAKPELGKPHEWIRLHWCLPRGFWAYSFGTQLVSLMGLLQRVDFILVLNFGGVKTLGEYVAITTLALAIPLINRLFYDTLLPSLTNLLAAGNRQAAAEVFRAHMRLLLLVVAVVTCGLVFLVTPLLAIFGPAYAGLRSSVLVLATLVGLASPAEAAGSLLSSIGKPHRAGWAILCQLGVFVALFFVLWPPLRLLGAALALGASFLVGKALLFVIATVSARLNVKVGWDYAKFCTVVLLAGTVSWLWPFHALWSDVIAWMSAVVVFLVVGKYRQEDRHELWQWVAPQFEIWWHRPSQSPIANVKGREEA